MNGTRLHPSVPIVKFLAFCPVQTGSIPHAVGIAENVAVVVVVRVLLLRFDCRVPCLMP